MEDGASSKERTLTLQSKLKQLRTQERKQRRINRLGNTIIESLVSLLLMTILFTTVATMIQTSMNMTGASLDDAIEMQEQTVNAIIASGGNLEGDEKDLIFTYEINGVAASANHVVIEGEKNGVTYFEPKRQ